MVVLTPQQVDRVLAIWEEGFETGIAIAGSGL